MKGQAAIENIFYYIVLFIGVAAVIYVIVQYIQDRAAEAQRANLYSFEQYVKTKFTSAERLGVGGYVELDLPSKINNYNYNITLTYNTTAKILNFFINLDNGITYPFQFYLSSIDLDTSNITLRPGGRYIIEIRLDGQIRKMYILSR